MTWFHQLLALTIKNIHVLRRKPAQLACEVCCSMFFSSLLLPLSIAPIKDLSAFLQPVESQFPVSDANNLTGQFQLKSRYDGRNFTILYAPSNIATDGLMLHFKDLLEEKHNISVTTKQFAKESDLLVARSAAADAVDLAIIFENVHPNDTALPNKLRCVLRPKEQNALTAFTYPNVKERVYSGEKTEYKELLFLQRVLVQSFIHSHKRDKNLDDYQFFVQPMPSLPPQHHPSFYIWPILFFLLITFASMPGNLASNIITEKQLQLKEAMKIAGLRSSAYWISHFLTTLMITAVIISFTTICLTLEVPGGTAIIKGNAGLVFLLHLLLACAIAAFGIMISTFFQKAILGTFATLVFMFATTIASVSFLNLSRTSSITTNIFSALMFPLAYWYGIDILLHLQGLHGGASLSNVHMEPSEYVHFTLLLSFVMLIVDTILYLMIAWYVDNVYPGEYGVPKPLYFLCTAAYWTGPSSARVRQSDNEVPGPPHADKNFEPDPTNLEPGVVIEKLTKSFGDKSPVVAGISLKLFKNQIFVLLGKNGVGKTTTVSMLSGFLSPTSGTAKIDNYDLVKDLESVRRCVGLCTQKDLLWDDLTVAEHLAFYARMRNVRLDIVALARSVGLSTKIKTQAKALSGGQKRKLCLGIALIGGAKVLFLDEPTSGLDPASRREVWEILKQNKNGRTILLTTHSLDEADILGDRVAIMVDGHVICCGTPQFLKRVYSIGYQLTIVTTVGTDTSALTKAVKDIMKDAMETSSKGSEVAYRLPEGRVAACCQLFDFLDANKERLGVSSYGVHATTLEDAFLSAVETPAGPSYSHDTASRKSLSDDAASRKSITKKKSQQRIVHHLVEYMKYMDRNPGYRRQGSQFEALFKMKGLRVFRKPIFLFQILLPVLFITVTYFSSTSSTKKLTTNFRLELDLSPFKCAVAPYSEGKTPSNLSKTLADAYRKVVVMMGRRVQSADLVNNGSLEQYFLSKLKESPSARQFDSTFVVGAEFVSTKSPTVNVTAWFNPFVLHSQPISFGIVLNAAIQREIGRDYYLQMINHPFQSRESTKGTEMAAPQLREIYELIESSNIVLSLIIVLCIVPLVEEQAAGVKALLIMSGLSPLVFWLTNLISDFIVYFLSICITLSVCIAIFPSTSGEIIINIVVLYLLAGLHGIPTVYLVHFLFQNPVTAVVVTILIAALAPPLISSLLRIIAPKVTAGLPGLGLIGTFGSYPKEVLEIFKKHAQSVDICREAAQLCQKNPLAKDILFGPPPSARNYFISMLVQFVLFYLLTLVVDYGYLKWLVRLLPSCRRAAPANFSQVDSDVVEAYRRIKSQNIAHSVDAVVLNDVVKIYCGCTRLLAVNHLSVGIGDRACFGLIGHNGAGKSTTFKMIVGDISTTSGNIYCRKLNMIKPSSRVQANMGYCPQNNPLLTFLTCREMLTMVALLREVPKEKLKDIVQSLFVSLGMEEFAERKCGNISGGTQRKLSTAMALVGAPKIILLDEPTTGVDPEARRQLWTLLSEIRETGRTIILTSHSMEECEALCTDVGIMVKGQFACLGSVQHLKSKFATSYTATVHGEDERIQEMWAFLNARFSGVEAEILQKGYWNFRIEVKNIRLAALFQTLEECSQKFQLEDYSVQQASLEDVFLSLAKSK